MKKFLAILTSLYLLSACTNNDQFTWENKYDDNGRLIKMIQPGGKNISFKYEMDDNNPDLVRKLIKKGKGEKVVIEYNRFGRKTSMTDNVGKEDYEYDLAGNLSAVKRENFPAIYYENNTLGQLTSIKTDNGYFANYEYDFLGRISGINSPAGKITYEYYRAQGMVKRTFPNGIKTYWTYGPDNKLQSIEHIDENNYILHAYYYTYSPDGLITQINEQTQQVKTSKDYTYDSEQCLIAYSCSDGEKIEFKYDDLGNRITMTTNKGESEEATYDWAGRIITLNDKTLKYDKSGNLLTNEHGEKIYSYNVNNQLAEASDVSYEYNGNGKLTKKNTKSNSTKFVTNVLSDIWQPLIAENNNSKTFYIWNGTTAVAQITDGEIGFLLNDHLNSPRELVDSKAAIQSKQEYGPFGVPKNNRNTEQINPGFTGLFYDHTTNVYLTATRAYKPELARFLQMDHLKQVPTESQKVLSSFVYCGNDPVNFFDSNGMQSESKEKEQQWDMSGRDAWFIVLELRNIELEVRKKIEQNPILLYLPNSQRESLVRNLTIDKFSSKYGFGGSDVGGQFWNKHIYNTNILTPDGWANMDWGSSTDKHDIFKSSLSSAITYTAGKTGWNIYGSKRGLKKGPNIFEWYPKRDKRGYEVLKNIRNQPNKQYEEFFVRTSHLPANQTSQRIKGIQNDAITSYMHNSNTSTNINKQKDFISNIYNNTSQLLDNINRNFNPFYVSEAEASEPPSIPSNVGGVYLKGAGSALEGIQSLSGIALDEISGKIILLSEEDAEIDIPPLRLDDVVTIFRCVYEQGEAPYVSIDPDPKNPEGPVMLSRHGKETENTYVGWILFETDRVMKAYSLGQDNVTNQPVNTSIAGYQEVLDAQFDLRPGKHSWERFWIVPAEVNKKQTEKKELTLYDIPLKLKTEKMILRNGKLETDPIGKSSKGAQMFSEWFTKNYEKIAKENRILPPEGSGFTEPVPIFSELQRMALMTAIAEQLRDQGVPFPLWMRDYKVNKFPTPLTTPAITISRERDNSTLTIYGGVSLNTTDKSIEKVTVVPEAIHILKQTKKEIRAVPMLETKTYKSGNKKMAALALPGNNTKALTPCQLNEVDVALPLTGGGYLTFNRQYNSFYHPKNTEFNRLWTMNLLRLENPERQIRTADNQLMVDKGHFFITTPLNVYYDDDITFYNFNDNRIDANSRMCILQNGDKGYFNEDGYLTGYRSGLLYQYIRDENNQIVKIEAWKGRKVIGSINLNYDFKNRLSSITAENQQLVKYTYAPDGLLKYVIKPYETILYSYTGENNLVKSITINDKLFQKFTYNEKAQLIAQSGEFGEVEIKLVHNGDKFEMMQLIEGDDTKQQKMVYDHAMRPLYQLDVNKSETSWDYSDPRETKISYKTPEGYEFGISRTNDNQSEVIKYPDGNTVASQYDSRGNLLSINQNGEQIVTQDYYNDGKLQSSTYETFSIVPEYDEYGETSGITISDANPEKANRNWQNTQYDTDGNVINIQDYSGYQQQNLYDPDGNLNRIISSNGEMVLNRDNDNRVNSIQTSWGTGMENSYSPEGDIESVQLLNGDNKASMKFENGLIKNITDYNGNTTEYEYYTDSLNIGRVDKIKKENLLIDYEYNKEGDLSGVKVNDKFQWNYDQNDNKHIITFKKD